MLRIIAIVLVIGPVAHAGDLCAYDGAGDRDPGADVRSLEAYAEGDATADVRFIEWCLGGAHAYAARVVAACETIVARDKTWTDRCMVLAAEVGAPRVGTRDVFDWLARQPRGPWVTDLALPDFPIYLLGELRDPRGAALIVATWKDTIPVAARHEHDGPMMDEWSAWRQHTAEVLAQLGDGDTAAFLDEQALATVDVHVAQACRDAAGAIRERVLRTLLPPEVLAGALAALVAAVP